MRVLLINKVCGIGSTGRICVELAKEFEASGHEAKIAFGRDPTVPQEAEKYAVCIGSRLDTTFHALRTRLFDAHGLGSRRATKRFLQWADEYDPDLLWLHNIHGYYINYELLFDWIKSRPSMEIRWTLHDCWPFTGHCSYFTVAKCEQWKSHCSHCPQKKSYPSSLFLDNCRRNFERKKAAFTGVRNLTLITPSQWLANLVKESFLNEYPVEVRYNSIDTDVFKPTPSDFRERYGLQDKKIVLGVANVWDERKGLGDFIRLAGMLDDRYAIALVGLSAKQIRRLPKRIIGIQRTNSPTELAAIYTAADVFVNPSREETFGMTTLEADACGTPTIVYKDTACEEVVKNYCGGKDKMGRVVAPDTKHLYQEIISTPPHKEKYGNRLTVSSLICLPKTNSTSELAAIYTAADVFINLTYEDNYPTVNLEAQACGTFVLTYDSGGCPETIHTACSKVLACGDLPAVTNAIERTSHDYLR